MFCFSATNGNDGCSSCNGNIANSWNVNFVFTFYKNKSGFKFVNTRYNFKTSKDISALGAGTLVSQLASGVTIALFNNVVLHLSDNTGLAAYGVIANIAFVVTAMFAGIADGYNPL